MNIAAVCTAYEPSAHGNRVVFDVGAASVLEQNEDWRNPNGPARSGVRGQFEIYYTASDEGDIAFEVGALYQFDFDMVMDAAETQEALVEQREITLVSPDGSSVQHVRANDLAHENAQERAPRRRAQPRAVPAPTPTEKNKDKD